MKHLRRTIFCFVAATLAALVLGVPPAAAQLTLQTVGLSCSDGTALTVALGLTELTALADAVSAINLFPAGDPPLCGFGALRSASRYLLAGLQLFN